MPKITASQRFVGAEDGTFPYDVLVTANVDPVVAGAALVSAINAAASGAVIAVEPGNYKVATTPTYKANQLVAAYGGAGKAPVVVDGSAVLSSWTADGGTRWYSTTTFQARDSTMRDGTYSVCEDTAVTGTNLCWDRDQVWIDGDRMTRMATLAAGNSGSGDRFFTDRSTNRVYVWTDPTSRVIEINRNPYFVNDSAVSGVTFRRLTIERFASPLQRAGVSITGSGWNFLSCIFQNNHASGLHWANVTSCHVDDCEFLFNGQIGMTVGSTSSGLTYSNNLIENSHFEGNNQEDFYIGDWEAGGFKTSSVSGGIVRNCTFEDNKGLDLWVDFGGQWVFENNQSDNAFGQAIRIEVAKNCIVRNNTIVGSGSNIGAHYRASHTNWSTVFDTCAISLSESQFVECYNNTVIDPSLNGVIVNIRGRQDTHHVFSHHNVIEQRQTPVPTGDVGTSTFGTMIAGGAVMLSAPSPADTYFNNPVTWSMPAVGPSAGSGISATQSVQVSANTYRVGNLSTTARFVWRNGAAGAGTTYMTANTYITRNPADTTDVAV